MSSTPGNSAQIKHSIPIDILDDLCSRFIINLPPEDRGNLVRICFQIELAHWFYLDYYVTDESNRLNPCGIREFAAHIFQHVPQLREHVSNLDDVLDNWREYKQTVPTYGAILLDTELTHVLLVQSYWTKASWGFPKGKVNEGEEPYKCAAREVLEETGFDINKLMNKNDYIEAMIHDQVVRLYIVPYVPRETKFQPRTRNEIKACEWFALADLPANKKDMTPKTKLGVSPNAFFMVLPFVKRMRRWVSERNPKTFRRTRHKSMGEIESSTGKNKAKISQVLQNEIQEFQNSAQKPQYNKNQGNQHGNYSHGSHGIAQSNQSSSQHHGHASSYQGHHGVVTSQGSYVGSSQSNYSHVGNTQSNYYQGNSQGNYTGNTQVYHNQTSNIQANFNQAGNYSHSGNSQAQYSHAGNTQSSHSFAGNFGNQGHGSSQPSQNQTTQNTYSNPQQVPSASKNPTNRKDRKNTTKRQLFTPQNTHSNNFSPQNLPHNYSYPQNRQSTYSPQNRQNNSPQIRHNSPQVQNRQNTSPQNRQKYSPQVNRRNVSPQNSPAAHFTPVQNTSTPNNDDLSVFYNFIAPSWANFRFDRRAIQDCLT